MDAETRLREHTGVFATDCQYVFVLSYCTVLRAAAAAWFSAWRFRRVFGGQRHCRRTQPAAPLFRSSLLLTHPPQLSVPDFLFSGHLNDIYRFSPTTNAWTLLSATNPPVASWHMGFTATPDGSLYVFGGHTNSGGETALRAARARSSTILGVLACPAKG
jgi:hypothetical protein